MPGRAIDISRDITISGVPVHQPRGRYLLVPVRTERPSLLGVALEALHGNRKVLPFRADPGGEYGAEVQRQRAAQFGQSQTAAAMAAARAAGMPVGPAGQLPFTVRFRHRDIVGPSAGLIYALAIEDMLSTTDRAHGRVIAATGEIDPTGAVSAVGYPNEKAESAGRGGAQLFLVPHDPAGLAFGRGVPVEEVGSLQEALTHLATSSF